MNPENVITLVLSETMARRIKVARILQPKAIGSRMLSLQHAIALGLASFTAQADGYHLQFHASQLKVNFIDVSEITDKL